MKKDVPPLLKKSAEALMRWRFTEVLGAKDVLAWVRQDGVWCLSLQGPALRLENRILRADFPINNSGMQADASLQKAFGYDVSVQRTKFYWDFHGGVGQLMSEGMVSWDEAQPAIETVFSSAVGNDKTVMVTLMPMQGKPWNPGSQCTPYYSAKKKKVLCGTKPDGVIKLEGGQMGVDMCTVAPVVHETEGGVVGTFRGDDRFFVSHSFNVAQLRPSPASAAKAIAACGGLLYPSLAVSDVPASIFGPCCLFARLPIVLRSMRPYKSRSTGKPWAVTTYSTDAWTGVTGNYVGQESRALFEQLTGQSDVNEVLMIEHMAILGPRVEDYAGGFGSRYEAKVMKSTSQLRTKLAKKRKVWKRDVIPDEVRLERGDDPELRYPFLESKVNGVVAVQDTFPLAVCPSYLRSRTAKFLDAIGFNGDLLSIKVPAGIKAAQTGKASDLSSELAWKYAWMVREQVLQWQDLRDARFRRDDATWLTSVQE